MKVGLCEALVKTDEALTTQFRQKMIRGCIALVRQGRQLPDGPGLIQYEFELVSPAMASDSPSFVERR